MKKNILSNLITVVLILIVNFYSLGQTLKSPVTLDDKSYYYTTKKSFISTAEPNEGKVFTVPNNTIWLVDVSCKYCYLRVTKQSNYINNMGYEMDTDGNIPWGFLPVILYSGTAFVLYSNMLNSTDNISIEEYKIK